MNISKNAGYKYKFSIIMSVYCVEEFIDEAVESLLNQTLDFKENVQLIMVDDGSPDSSGAICDKYAALYPDNVLVIHKENGGLSSARNEGLRHIQGRYVNFFDPDDILTPNTLESVYDFFEKNDEFIDMVAIPLYYFDAKEGQHPTNVGKFNKGNRVISLRKDYTLIHNSVASAFIKHSVAEKMFFDPDLCAMEDAKALIQFLIFNPRYGVVSDCKYMYRQRTAGSVSLSHGASTRKNWYTDFIHRFSLSVINYCLENINYVPKFVQAVLLYDLHWKIELDQIPAGVLSPEEEDEFREAFYSVFNYIDDDLLMNSKFYYFEHKSLILSKKYKSEMMVDVYDNDALFTIHGNALRYFSNMCSTKLEQMKIVGNTLILEANTFILPMISEKFGNAKPVLLINGDRVVDCEIVERDMTKYVLGEHAFDNVSFRVNIDLSTIDYIDGSVTVELFVMLGDHRVKITKFSFSDFCAVTGRYKNQYAAMGNYIAYMQDSSIVIKPYSKKIHKAMEKAFRRELWQSNKLGERKAVIVRSIYSVLKRLKKKKIYLISDRINKADDNGEAMLRFYDSSAEYVKKNNIKYYFIIDKSSKFAKENKNRHIVQVYSMKHKLLHLLADNVLSSHADNFINKPMYETFDCYRDLVVYQNFVFLQHGITQNDISGWLNKYNKNIRGFVTAARPETKSLLTYDYYYNEDEVWELGFARFDRLFCDEKRRITLMPTWRKYLMNGSDDRTGIWALGQGFKSSAYYNFYNSLLNDARLLAACREYGYTLCFMPHPNIIPHIDVFDKNDEVTFFGIDTNYRDIYATSDMILTDYSSAAFDFAYLRKPLAYMHFDYDEFFGGNHVATPGYFKYRENGFGEVTSTVDETVDLIISYMQNGCKIKDEYRRRIDEFFAFNDKNNCQRIADKIVEISK